MPWTLCLALWPGVASAQTALWEKHTAAGVKAYQERRYAEAERSFQAALEAAQRLGSQDRRLVTSLSSLAELYSLQGQYAQAEPLLKQALAIREQALGPEHPDVARSLEHYSALLRKMNRAAEATEMEARGDAIWVKHARER
ncbi:MAG: tetratricopeptide repeat protein, partial [Candidatus Methylomirabilia bacterium]